MDICTSERIKKNFEPGPQWPLSLHLLLSTQAKGLLKYLKEKFTKSGQVKCNDNYIINHIFHTNVIR